MKAGLSLEKAIREEIEQALAKYPFFAMARMMVAKVATKEGDPRAPGLRFLASLYAPHRQYYAFFMGDRVRPIVSPPPRMGGQEVQTPREPSSKQEGTPSSSEEPGPADPMPFAPEYLPKLQGKLKAKVYLYRGLSERLRQAIRLPPLIAEPPQESLESVVPPPGDIPASQTLGETRPSEPPSPPLRSEEMPRLPPSDEETAPQTQSLSAGLPTLHLPPPTEIPASPPPTKLSPLLLTLQFELPEKPPQTPFSDKEPPTEVSSIPPSAPEALTASGESVLSSFVALESVVSEAQTPSPSEAAESTPPERGLVEPISAFTRPYVPLENPDAPVAPSKARTAPEESGAKPTSSLTPELFQSESPIRLILLPDFDPEGSVHLSVPEPAPLEEPPSSPSSEASKPISPPAESVSVEPSALSASKRLSPSWQSFLSEIEKPLAQVAQEAFSQAPQALEKLRQAFIRYLLEARKERRLPQEPPPPSPSTAIEEVLRLLETFQPKGLEAVSAPPIVGVPESEPPVSPPPIYTETMARLCWSQGDLPLAIEIYEKLKAKFPEKAAYYQAQIERIQRGERP